MSEKFNMKTQAESIQLKYTGTGTLETTKYEWLQNQHRDTLASTISNPHMLKTMAVAQNKSVARVRYEALQKMLRPIGESDK